MTSVVALTDKQTVWMGSDSAGCEDGGTIHLNTTGKVWRRGEFVMGMSASALAHLQVLQYDMELEGPPCNWSADDLAKEDQLRRYMVTVFAPAIRKCLEAHNLLEKDGTMDALLLVGIRGRIFTVEGAFGVNEDPEPFMAVGSGAAEAKGVLWALHAYSCDRNKEVALLEALKCSERYTTTVRAPFHFVSTEDQP